MKYTSDSLGTILGEYNSGHAYPIGKRVKSGMRWRSTVRLSRMMRSSVAHAGVGHHELHDLGINESNRTAHIPTISELTEGLYTQGVH